MNADTTKGIDLSACPVLSYRYKGAAHQIKLQDGQVKDYAYHFRKADDAATWTTVTFAQAEFKQPSWTETKIDLNWKNIKKMAWEVIGAHGYSDTYQPTYNYLYVDDLKCVSAVVGLKPVARSASGMKLGYHGKMLSVNFAKAGAARVQIFDLMGHVVESFNENVKAGANQFSLKNLSNGNYVVRVMMNGASKTARISIK